MCPCTHTGHPVGPWRQNQIPFLGQKAGNLQQGRQAWQLWLTLQGTGVGLHHEAALTQASLVLTAAPSPPPQEGGL